MIIQEDTVFVSGLPPSADTKEIAEFFGKIGILKVCIFFNRKKIYDIYSTFFLLIQSRSCLKFVTERSLILYHTKEMEKNIQSFSIFRYQIKLCDHASEILST